MGLSASQARLLSITARLTDNEYHSQQIANAKMRLAAKGTEARQEYQDALNSKILTYNGFDEQGNAVSTVLTPNVIYQYLPLKNQYSLINNAGQILVNHIDGKNFEETTTIIDFLNRYDVLDNYADYTSYQDLYNKYLDDHAAWVEEGVQWKDHKEAYEKYLKDYADWQASQPDQNLYELFANEIGTSANPKAACYQRAVQNGNATCYTHLLYMLLDYDGTLNITPKDYDASCDKNGGYDSELRKTHVNQSSGATMFDNHYAPIMKQVSDCINETDENGNLTRLCDGDDSFTPDYKNNGAPDTVKENLIQAAINEGRTPTALEILKSDYIYDPETNKVTGIKSLKQKAIDIYYMIQNSMVSGEYLKETLINFTEGDMKGISTDPPEEVVPPGELRAEPKPPEPPEIKIRDKEKAQWYLNLWCRMNGQEEPPRIQTKEGTDEMDEWFKHYVFNSKATIKDTFEQHYQEIDPYLSSNSTWLEDVLAQGIVVMQRVNSHNLDTQNKFSWDEIIYTDAAELTLETDDNAIAKAEVRYEEKMHEIEIKDKRYQMEINKLDSEHNSLQTQIDSIKSEVSKNIERSYKTFG